MAADEVRIRSDGRWHGRLTSRELPSDSSIDDLPDTARAVLSEMWLGRAASERRVGDAFVVVERALRELGASDGLRELARRAVDDELRHAELSRIVASRYAGAELDAPPLLALDVPEHRGATESERHLLHVVGHCCVNETIATAFLEVAIAGTTAPLAAAALRELLSDEVDHARIGWAVLASADACARSSVAHRLPAMAAATLRLWRTSPRGHSAGELLPSHGMPSDAAVEDAFKIAFRDLIVPGCEALALDTARLRSWVAGGAPT